MTPHFTLSEMTRSQYAVRHGLSNVPNVASRDALQDLCEHVLEPVRAHFGKPVRVSSGYRAPAVNRGVGGSGTSDHCYGRAADFTVDGYSNLEVCQWIEANLDFKQLINEYGEDGWVHCAYKAGGNTGSVLQAKRIKGKTVYIKGLP